MSATGEGVENCGMHAKSDYTISKEVSSCPKWNITFSLRKELKEGKMLQLSRIMLILGEEHTFHGIVYY